MCLGQIARVTGVVDDVALVTHGDGRAGTVSLLTLDDSVGPGDHLLVHAGFALAVLTEQEARDAVEVRSRVAGSS